MVAGGVLLEAGREAHGRRDRGLRFIQRLVHGPAVQSEPSALALFNHERPGTTPAINGKGPGQGIVSGHALKTEVLRAPSQDGRLRG